MLSYIKSDEKCKYKISLKWDMEKQISGTEKNNRLEPMNSGRRVVVTRRGRERKHDER